MFAEPLLRAAWPVNLAFGCQQRNPDYRYGLFRNQIHKVRDKSLRRAKSERALKSQANFQISRKTFTNTHKYTRNCLAHVPRPHSWTPQWFDGKLFNVARSEAGRNSHLKLFPSRFFAAFLLMSLNKCPNLHRRRGRGLQQQISHHAWLMLQNFCAFSFFVFFFSFLFLFLQRKSFPIEIVSVLNCTCLTL